MKIFKLLLAVVVVALLFSNCKYSFIVPFEEPDGPDNPDSTVVVSFKDDIIPIWNNGNNCTTSACHVAGKVRPDLTPDNAFSAINSTRYINSSNPEESLIYTYPHPDTNTHQRKKYNSAQAAKILKWIEEGAKNN